jgi:RNA polymerase sigma-70 factor (ECF subfamily)
MGQSEHSKLTEALSDLAREKRSRSADADDAAQDAFLRAMQSPKRDGIRDPVRYLFRVMRNLMIDRKRGAAREAAALGSLSIVDASTRTPDPERVLSSKQELALVLAEIKRLPPRCREAFVLHRFKGLSYPAIAKRMGISVSMVEKHIAEAMLRISRATRDGHGDTP